VFKFLINIWGDLKQESSKDPWLAEQYILNLSISNKAGLYLLSVVK